MIFIFSILLKQTFALLRGCINTHVLFRFFMNYLHLNIFIHMCVRARVRMRVCATCVQVPLEAGREHRFRRCRSFRRLCSGRLAWVPWVEETGLRSSAKAVSAPNCQSSPCPTWGGLCGKEFTKESGALVLESDYHLVSRQCSACSLLPAPPRPAPPCPPR